jgi:hypothetical protein
LPVARPKFAAFIWERQMELKAVAEAIGCSHEQVRLMSLPFGHPRRRVPGEALMGRIVRWTDGEITPADFYPANLTVPAEHEASA